MHWEYVSAYLSGSAHACPSVRVCVSAGVRVCVRFFRSVETLWWETVVP